MEAGVLAGNSGAAPPPALVALVLVLLAMAFVVSASVAWVRRRQEEPLRKEIQARPVVMFRASVDVNAEFFGRMTPQRGRMNLDVRGDAFEVSHPFPPARFMFGQDYCYRAQDTTIEIVPGRWHDWIEIAGQPGPRTVRIQIGRRKTNRQIWDALILAGSHPIGSPPP